MNYDLTACFQHFGRNVECDCSAVGEGDDLLCVQFTLQEASVEIKAEHAAVHFLANIPKKVFIVQAGSDISSVFIGDLLTHHIALFMVGQLCFRFCPCPKVLSQDIEAKCFALVNGIALVLESLNTLTVFTSMPFPLYVMSRGVSRILEPPRNKYDIFVPALTGTRYLPLISQA